MHDIIRDKFAKTLVVFLSTTFEMTKIGNKIFLRKTWREIDREPQNNDWYSDKI